MNPKRNILFDRFLVLLGWVTQSEIAGKYEKEFD